jgi:pimeloyl-ACP methyl ester carboxylesterase
VGRADGRPLLFWPGLNPWGELQLVEVGPLLAERGFRVISICPPVLDDPDGYLPSRLSDLILTVADDAGVDGLGFMGHSWGASIGVRLAADHPERVEALVLLDAGHTDVRQIESLEELVREFEADQAEFSFESWDAFLDWVKAERVRAWRPELEAGTAPGWQSATAGSWPASPRAPRRGRFTVSPSSSRARCTSGCAFRCFWSLRTTPTTKPSSASEGSCQRPESSRSLRATTRSRTRPTRRCGS